MIDTSAIYYKLCHQCNHWTEYTPDCACTECGQPLIGKQPDAPKPIADFFCMAYGSMGEEVAA